MITRKQLETAYNYQEYKKLLEELLAQGKTTGHDQSEEKVGYAKVNIQRMHRVEKTVSVDKNLKLLLADISSEYIWLVITEGWCGDTAQIVPVLNAIASATPKIGLLFLLRDDNPEVMGQYLTNGARSIPKLICLKKDTLEEVFVWGPRPAPLQKLVMQMVKDNVPKDEKGLIVQKWYNADQAVTIQEELRKLISAHMRV